MELRVIATSKPNEEIGKNFNTSSMKGMAGRFANVCYMNGTMDELLNQPEESSLKRADNCINNGHHSVFDHISISVALTGIPKIIAMYLNSFKIYGTSEKSARYCKMKGFNEDDNNLYLKWIDKLFPIIQQNMPELDKKTANKLAMENARYFISVLSPCSEMVYTTNLRQWGYIYQSFSLLCEFYLSYFNKRDNMKNFVETNIPYIEELNSLIKKEILDKFNVDLKTNKTLFNPVTFIDTANLYKIEDTKETAGLNYVSKNYMSFSCLAQKMRSRTLSFNFDFCLTNSCVVPKILNGHEDLINEWNCDMESIYSLYPQGMKLNVIERGSVEDFFKFQVTERICNRAQLEIYTIVRKQSGKILCSVLSDNSLSESYKNWVFSFFTDGQIKTKCSLVGCASPCGKKCDKNRVV